MVNLYWKSWEKFPVTSTYLNRGERVQVVSRPVDQPPLLKVSREQEEGTGRTFTFGSAPWLGPAPAGIAGIAPQIAKHVWETKVFLPEQSPFTGGHGQVKPTFLIQYHRHTRCWTSEDMAKEPKMMGRQLSEDNPEGPEFLISGQEQHAHTTNIHWC